MDALKYFLILSCLHLSLFAYCADDFKIKYSDASHDFDLYLNGFYYNKYVSSIGDCNNSLISGENTIVLIPRQKNNEAKVNFEIRNWPDGGIRETVFKYYGSLSEKTELKFELLSPITKWSWQNADEITELSEKDKIELKQHTDDFIKSFKDGNIEYIVNSLLVPYFKDSASFDSMTYEKATKTFIAAYHEFLGPNSRQKWTDYEGEYEYQTNRYNTKIVRVIRKNGDPLLEYTPALISIDIKWYSIYYFTKDGKWYIAKYY
jgi:hypothetical protein